MKRVIRDVVVGAVSCVASVGAGAGVLISGASDAYAQDNQVQPPAPAEQASNVAIRRVVVEGNQRIEPSTITSYLLVRPGETFDPERIDLSLKTLFATGLFADVQIEQRDARPFLAHAPRRRCADAERCAGDDGDLVFEPVHGCFSLCGGKLKRRFGAAIDLAQGPAA